MGILGAFGKMNLTFSNFPLRRQFSASDTLIVGVSRAVAFIERNSPSGSTAMLSVVMLARSVCAIPTCHLDRVP